MCNCPYSSTRVPQMNSSISLFSKKAFYQYNVLEQAFKHYLSDTIGGTQLRSVRRAIARLSLFLGMWDVQIVLCHLQECERILLSTSIICLYKSEKNEKQQQQQQPKKGDNPTAILSCAAKAALRVFVARTTRAQYEAVIKNGINYTALYIRALCSLTVVDLFCPKYSSLKIHHCGGHLLWDFTVVVIFYGTILFMYAKPKSKDPLGADKQDVSDKLISLFYGLLTPMLNPIIYSLRNKDVQTAVRYLRSPMDLCTWAPALMTTNTLRTATFEDSRSHYRKSEVTVTFWEHILSILQELASEIGVSLNHRKLERRDLSDPSPLSAFSVHVKIKITIIISEEERGSREVNTFAQDAIAILEQSHSWNSNYP
ncbi:hypothetical protein PANDA_019094 [Ailuropoda melanoleuca]|uniref:G-protein coupled receptors family 1 profile domain-containing protein n=1 Tax=Ailuropoda melanoleuca TaxID=9646 RepID=D2I1D6_AILME|nr:hypothetical protein PANDA_019094 [Ailuropoda melanoleuca]